MKKDGFSERIRDGFFELAPDIFDDIAGAIENDDRNGRIINMPDNKKKRHIYNKTLIRVLCSAAILVLLIGLGVGLYGTGHENGAYVVVMDVNPSIKFELDESYSVREVTGLNPDGEDIIKRLDWEKNSSVERLIGTVTDRLVSEGYLTENGGILITILKNNKDYDYEQLKEILNSELECDVEKNGVAGIKVAFQSIESKTDKTGREILKENMIKEYNINDKSIDEMNIGEMINYVEDNDGGILEKVVDKKKDKLTVNNKNKQHKDDSDDSDTEKNIDKSSGKKDGNGGNNSQKDDDKEIRGTIREKEERKEEKNAADNIDKKSVSSDNSSGHITRDNNDKCRDTAVTAGPRNTAIPERVHSKENVISGNVGADANEPAGIDNPNRQDDDNSQAKNDRDSISDKRKHSDGDNDNADKGDARVNTDDHGIIDNYPARQDEYRDNKHDDERSMGNNNDNRTEEERKENSRNVLPDIGGVSNGDKWYGYGDWYNRGMFRYNNEMLNEEKGEHSHDKHK